MRFPTPGCSGLFSVIPLSTTGIAVWGDDTPGASLYVGRPWFGWTLMLENNGGNLDDVISYFQYLLLANL